MDEEIAEKEVDASMRELDDAAEDLGEREAKDGKAEKTRKRWRRKKKRNHDEQRGGMWATENKAIVDEAIVVNAVAHVRENESENNSDSYMEAAAKEGEALLKELGLKDNNVPDSGRRRTRSQTRGTTAAPAERKTPTKPARGAKKAAASKRSKKEESEEEEEEEAASAEEDSTTAAYEDGSADSVEKKDEKDKVNNEEDAGKARLADSEDASADYTEEPEVKNTEEEPTTDSGSKATAMTTADPNLM
ncbi:myb-like protein V [Rhipicephalus sanguineus]|uniref:myb-like protein V n=1 Tax=Rhipicephalus sanguineus TaxID=34632 RepID=UPI0020C56D25|nr:myb-like protein V [Rhipicephalus sanguineus]